MRLAPSGSVSLGGEMFNLLKYLCPAFVRHIMFIIRVTPSIMIIMSLLFIFLLQLRIIEIRAY